MTRFFLLHKGAMLQAESESVKVFFNFNFVLIFLIHNLKCNWNEFLTSPSPHLMCNPLTGQAVSRKVRLTR